MATKIISGADFLSEQLSSFENNSDRTVFLPFLSLDPILEQTWDTQSFDDESQKGSLKWTSSQGSSITFKYSSSGNDAAGNSKGEISVIGDSNRCNINGTWSGSWSSSVKKEANVTNWVFLGDPETKSDDVSYKEITSSTEQNDQTEPSAFLESYDFLNSKYKYQFSASKSVVGNSYAVSGKYLFSDLLSGESLSFSATQSLGADGIVKINLSGLKYLLPEYTVTTSKYLLVITENENDTIPHLDPEVENFDILKNNFKFVNELILKGDNTITIKSSNGVDVDAGPGNDKITGGAGEDQLIAGAGRDTLIGGKGNDTFVLSKEDYDFSSPRSLLVDTITDFKYSVNGEQDTLELSGFGSIEAYKTLASAREAQSTAEVIYESKTGKFWFNTDDSGSLVGVVSFATVKGIPDIFLEESGWLFS